MIETADPLVADRINWLASQRNLEVVISNQSSERPLGSLVIRIAEDDTQFELYSSSGLRILPDELAERINRSSALRSMHMTAHADTASEDSGSPTPAAPIRGTNRRRPRFPRNPRPLATLQLPARDSGRVGAAGGGP